MCSQRPTSGRIHLGVSMITKTSLSALSSRILELALGSNNHYAMLCDHLGQDRRACLGIRFLAAVATIARPSDGVPAQDFFAMACLSLTIVKSTYIDWAAEGIGRVQTLAVETATSSYHRLSDYVQSSSRRPVLRADEVTN